jgi:hypothetical protein
MPTKKAPPKKLAGGGEVVEPPSAPPAPEIELCGHVNRHSLGLDKKQDGLACDLRKGHHGDHEGWHIEYEKHEVTKIVKGEEETNIVYEPVQVRRQWGDAAGVPVSEIPAPPPVSQPTMASLEQRVQKLERK